MTIDEVIATERKLAENYKIEYESEVYRYGKDFIEIYKEDLDCFVNMRYHETIAERLKELKALKNGLPIMCDNLNYAIKKGKKIGYIEAIADLEDKFLECKKVQYNLQDLLYILNELKEAKY